MAKAKGRPKKSDRDDQTVKMDRGIVARAKMVAAARKIPLAEYLSESVRGVVDKDFTAEFRKLGGK